ncbi:MAG: flagellar biosynthetic protein FliO [Pseudomonadota bacterium]
MAIIRFMKKLAARLRFWTPSILAAGVIFAATAFGADQPGTSPITPVVDLEQAASLGLTLLKVFGALILTVGLMLLISIWLRKLGLARSGVYQGSLIKVIDTKMIAPKKFVAVVRVANETLALGVTDQQITMLSRLDSANISLADDERNEGQPAASFSTLLGKALKRGDK